MNKTKKLRGASKKVKRNKNCKTKCKTKFANEIKTDTRYKMFQKFASFFTKKNVVEEQTNLILDSKDIQNDDVFKDCVKKCENK